MDKSSYWETFITILISEEVKTEANNCQFNLFQTNELVFQILINTFSQGIADLKCLDFKRSFRGL